MKTAIFANSVDLDEGGGGARLRILQGWGGGHGEAKFPAGT